MVELRPQDRRRRLTVLPILALGLSLLTVAPNLTGPMPDRDSGVFLWVGSQILEGKVPYQDVWDHKGPLMYMLNALGVLLDPGGELGIWLLEVLALALSGGLLAGLVRRRRGVLASAVSLVLFYGGLALVLRPGNYTEEFALPFALGSLGILDRWDRNRRPGWLVGLGVCLAAALLLRPNLGLLPALAAATALRPPEGERKLAVLRSVAWVLVGVSVATLPIVLYLFAGGALAAAWDEYVIFNLVYLGQGTTPAINVVAEGLLTLAGSGASVVGLLGWATLCVEMGSERRGLRQDPTLLAVAVDLPAELVLTAVGGRGISHYFITWLPALAVIGGIGLDGILVRRKRFPPLRLDRRWIELGVIGLAMLLALRRTVPAVFFLLREGPRDGSRVAAPLAAHHDRRLLMWGAETAYHYFSGRPAASRYVYQYPLYTCGYASADRVDEFRNDIERALPLIVDTSATNNRVPPLDPDLRRQVPELTEECALAPPLVALMEFIWERYEQVGRMPDTGWPILAPRR